MNRTKLLQLLDEIRAAIDDVPAIPAPVEVDPEAPFGKNANGIPNFAPAYDKARGLWEAAQRYGVFSIFPFIGGGVQMGGAQMFSNFKPNLQAIEDAINALGMSPWGQAWLADDRNAALIDRSYCQRYVGYYVVRKNQNDESEGYDRIR